MTNKNPFSVTFGKEPKEIISRKEELSEVYGSLSEGLSNDEVFIISGARGSGKTVAMTTIGDYYREQQGWIVVDLNPEGNLLEQLASKIIDQGRMKRLFLKAEFNFSFKGLGFSLSGERPLESVSSLLSKELEHLKSKGERLLITIDEISPKQNIRIFVHEFQAFLRAKYDVYLLMTGLYQNVSSFTQQRSVTFLCRAPKIILRPLNLMAIAHSYAEIFGLDETSSAKLAKFTKGYAYAYQLLGDILFISGEHSLSEDNVRKFDETIYERAYSIIYKELSPREKAILMASLDDNSNKGVMEKTGMSKSQLSNYKSVLAKEGLIEERSEGIAFALPRFKEFLSFMRSMEE